jgi:hypothetical protein
MSRSCNAILQFYRQSLESKGWTLAEELTQGKNPHIIYHWKSHEELVPWNEDVSIGCVILSEMGTRISMYQRRWPDPYRVPTYPGAQHVEEKCTSVAEAGIDREVVFQADAEMFNIETYYEKVLPEHGWWLENPEMHESKPTLFARNLRWHGQAVKGADLTLTIGPFQNGRREVKLQIHALVDEVTPCSQE